MTVTDPGAIPVPGVTDGGQIAGGKLRQRSAVAVLTASATQAAVDFGGTRHQASCAAWPTYEAARFSPGAASDGIMIASNVGAYVKPIAEHIMAMALSLAKRKRTLAKVVADITRENTSTPAVGTGPTRPLWRTNTPEEAAMAESAEFPGRAVAALTVGDNVLEKSGQAFITPRAGPAAFSGKFYASARGASRSRYSPAGTGKQGPSVSPGYGTVLVAGALSGGLLAAADALLFGRTGDDGERLEWSAQHPSRVDAATVDSLAGVLAAQRRAEDRGGALSVMAPVLAQLTIIEEMVRRARGPVRPALVNVAQQWAQFAAYLHRDTGDAEGDRARLAQALEWADELGDRTMAATVFACRADTALASGGLVPLSASRKLRSVTVQSMPGSGQRPPILKPGRTPARAIP